VHAATLAVAAACAVPTSALAAEHVRDGGFEASTCDATDCADSSWDPSVSTAFAFGTGPICRSGTGSGNTDCNGQGSAPFSGSTWARLGAGFKASAMFGGGVISSLEQAVPMPTAPATLSFRLRIIDVTGPTGEFTVDAGGSQVFAATDLTPGFASYAPVTIDVSSLAGTSPMLHFEANSGQDPVGALDSFDVDDISLTTTDPSVTQPNPVQRKKCRKHKRKRFAGSAKKKCKKKGRR